MSHKKQSKKKFHLDMRVRSFVCLACQTAIVLLQQNVIMKRAGGDGFYIYSKISDHSFLLSTSSLTGRFFDGELSR